MLRLFGFSGSANLAPHMVLEELGLPYEYVELNNEKQEHKSAEYLKLNPNGRVPTLVDGEQVLYEAAAICLDLCERVAKTELLPPAGTPARSQVYKWLMFLTNTLQPALIGYFYPGRYSTDASHADAIKAQAEITAQNLYRQLDAELGRLGPYLTGETCTVADLFLFMLVRWGRWFAAPPATTLPNIARLVALVSERPAVQRAYAQEGIAAPYCLLAQ